MDPWVIHASRNTLLSKIWLSEKCKRIEVPSWVHLLCPEPAQRVGKHRHKNAVACLSLPRYHAEHHNSHTHTQEPLSLSRALPYLPCTLVWEPALHMPQGPQHESFCLCLLLYVFSHFSHCSPAASRCLHTCPNDRSKSNWHHVSVYTHSSLWILQLSLRRGTFSASYA